MEYEMNKLGWYFYTTSAGRLVFRNKAKRLAVFKTWGKVREFVNASKAA